MSKMYDCLNKCKCATCKRIETNCAECEHSVNRTKECVTVMIKECEYFEPITTIF